MRGQPSTLTAGYTASTSVLCLLYYLGSWGGQPTTLTAGYTASTAAYMNQMTSHGAFFR